MLETDLSPPTGDTTVYLKDYQPPRFLIRKVELDFRLGEDYTEVVARSEFERNGEHTEALILNGKKLQLVEVKLAGRVLAESDYSVSDTKLMIAEVPDKFTLEIHTRLQPQLNTELSGLYRSSGNFCTQCEAEGFRRITYFLDRPDVLAEYEVTLRADKQKYPVLLSNGNPLAHGDNSDGTHWARWHDPHPKPCYLFALVAGQLEAVTDQFTTMSGREVTLAIYAQAHNIDKCAHAMRSLKKSMLWDEQVYGREYDLNVYNIVAVDDFNMGAMENKGLNIFNSRYVLANQQTATDTDYQNIEGVIGHEYFHNWSGNRVTCRDWFQLSLKEGFTVFRDQEFSADMGSRAVKRIRDVQGLRTFQFREDAGPMAHPVRPDSYQEINNFYTSTVYNKGAEVIRMLHRIVGASGFRAATDYYFSKYDGQAVTTEDFVQCVEKTNDIDLTQFRLWYTQAGTPEVTVEQHFDAGAGRLSLSIEQVCPPTPRQAEKAPMQIPLAVALFDQSGNKVEERLLILTEAKQRFDFADLSTLPVVSFLREFSAPVKVHYAQSNAELAHLVEHDDDGFSRFEAVQRLFLNTLQPAIMQSADELDEEQYQTLYLALKGLMDKPPSDQAVFSEMLTLPPLSYVAEQCRPIDPQQVFKTYRLLQQRLAADLHTEWHALYLTCQPPVDQEFRLDAKAMAKRALKNTLLRSLLHGGDEAVFAMAEEQYRQADNMTDRLAAFSALLQSEYSAKAELIADFYAAWQDDALVLDKWFAMQALIPELKVLAAVHDLLDHPKFSISNPNKVYSLIGSFAGNMRTFHRTDGSGYALLADVILQLNKINPQVGSRMAGTFNSWRAYAEPYSGNMRQQLERIAAEPKLSRDIREIVSKALQEA